MGKDPFSYQIFFEKVFNPIALYRVEGDVRSVPSADRIFYVDVNPGDMSCALPSRGPRL